ncbi:MAG: MBOAT family protein [Deltaproteobacteria bacterium]|nr:MBOAT family protein [Deltaproteobacteria bacterium]
MRLRRGAVWLPRRGASCYFYMAFVPKYILVLVFLIITDYFAAIAIENSKNQKSRMRFLLVSLVFNVGTLAVFKYFNFFNSNLAEVFKLLDLHYPVANLSWLLPIGLSFHTFQSMAYTIDVYYGNARAERHLGYFALYVMYYPQLVAGPIERPGELLPQLHKKADFDPVQVSAGLKRMLLGFFKKVVIADNVSILVNLVYGDPRAHTGLPLIAATYFFAIQIFCDFSGYSDIALGAAQVMGVRLSENFNRPYLSRSVAEFWTRWHMSLSRWLRDYLYLPLSLSGRNRGTLFANSWKTMAVFLICGLWHGANWNFIAFGGLHGFYITTSLWTKRVRKKTGDRLGLKRIPMLHGAFKSFVVFHLVLITWVFFRSASLSQAFYILKHCLDGLSIDAFRHLPELVGEYERKSILVGLLSGCALLCFQTITDTPHLKARFSAALGFNQSFVPRWIFLYGVMLVIMWWGSGDTGEFIYFQF